ncbi:hypothetical protein ABK040_005424 [Willaertia magna]
MYFPVGWINTFQCLDKEFNDDDEIKGVAFNQHLPIVAISTKRSLSLWTIQQDGFHLEQRIELKTIPHGTDMLWKVFPDYSLLLLGLETSKLLLFKVYYNSNINSSNLNETSSYEKEYRKLRCSTSSSISCRIRMELFQTLDCEYGNVMSICSDRQHLIVGTTLGSLILFSWRSGEFIQFISSDFIYSSLPEDYKKKIDNNDNEMGIVSLHYDFHRNIYAMVLKCGLLLFVTEEITLNLKNLKVIKIIDHLNSVCVQFNRRYNLVAVGCKNGDVVLLEISKDYQFNERSRLSMSYRGFTENEIGQVSSLCFSSHDGYAIAVGYSKRGFAIFHISGVCIMTTLPNVLERMISSNTSNSNITLSKKMETFESGVRTIGWDSEGYHLLAASNDNSTLLDISFCKSVMCRTPSQSKSPYLLLQSADKLLRFHMSSGANFVNADWEPLQIPVSYLTFNYPMKYVAVSGDGNHIALAGRRGCILYNSMIKKWRMFGSLTQEYKIKCYGITWIDNVVLALVSRNEKNESELLLFPRYHLDESSLICKDIITDRKILFIDTTSVLLRITKDETKIVPLIFLYDESMKLHIYSCSIEYLITKQIKALLTKIDTIDMSEFHKDVLPRSMTSVYCKSNVNINSTENYKLLSSVRVMFLRANGDLTVLQINTNKEYLLETGVDTFWIDNELSYNDNIVYFTYNGKHKRGTDMSIVYLTKLHTSHIRIKNIIPFDLDAIPLGTLKENGVFLHILETIRHRIDNNNENHHLFIENPLGFPYYEMQPKMYPYIHGLLLGLLFQCKINNEISELIHFAKHLPILKYSPLTFLANLEWMLHYVLVVGSSSNDHSFSIEILNNNEFIKIDLQNGLLSVIQFLRNFDQFYEIIINCLRKTDIIHWDKLFTSIGESSTQVFNHCINNNLIYPAANMLRILQHTEGIDQVLNYSYEVLKLALKLFQFELSNDIIRFIKMLEEEKIAELKENGLDNNNTDNNNNGYLINNDDDWFGNVMIQNILSIQCRELMIHGDLFALLQLERNLNISINKWLNAGEKDKSGKLPLMKVDEEDTNNYWEDLFDNLHKSFNLPRACTLPEGKIQKDLSLQRTNHLRKNFESIVSYFTTTQFTLYLINDLVSDLKYLHNCFHMNHCYGFTLLLSTILCDVDYIVNILKENKEYQSFYLKLLLHPNNKEYIILRQYIQQQISDN